MLISKVANKPAFTAQFSETKQKEFMELAQNASKNSTCQRAQTGAVVVNSEGNIVGKGWNATPIGIDTCKDRGGCVRVKYNIPSGTLYEQTCQNIHAEVNAISSAGFKDTNKGTLFLFGHYHLCNPCKIMTIRSGVEDVYVQHKHSDAIKHFL